MKPITRRECLSGSIAAGLAFGLPRLAAKAAGPNEEVRIAVIGLGGINTVGGVGGRGRQLIARLRTIAGVRIAALCDIDQDILDHEVQQFKDRGENVAAYGNMRKVFDDKTIDAVVIAIPNHWHALATIWACEAGKDVYVEKPFSYNLWEGRQAVAAASKYGRVVQVGMQRRSSEGLKQAFDYLRSGELGPLRGSCHRVPRTRRPGQSRRALAVPSTVDYDQWCGPAPKVPLMRKQLHYDWHWFWATGNGEIGNNGIHALDVCRWALGQNNPPRRALSIAGRFGFDDGGETPNTHVAFFDYPIAPLICEVRNLRTGKRADSIGKFRSFDRGIVITCEGGYFAGESSGGTAFDRQDRKVKVFGEGGKAEELETAHLSNFLSAVRSRKADGLHAKALDGHLSTAWCTWPISRIGSAD